MHTHPLAKAASIVGSKASLAHLLGVTKAAVSQWTEIGRRVPAEHCPRIEGATRGAVRCEELRPDVEWHVLRNDGACKSSAAVRPGSGGHDAV